MSVADMTPRPRLRLALMLLVSALTSTWYLCRETSTRNRYFFAGMVALSLFAAGWQVMRYREETRRGESKGQ